MRPIVLDGKGWKGLCEIRPSPEIAAQLLEAKLAVKVKLSFVLPSSDETVTPLPASTSWSLEREPRRPQTRTPGRPTPIPSQRHRKPSSPATCDGARRERRPIGKADSKRRMSRCCDARGTTLRRTAPWASHNGHTSLRQPSPPDRLLTRGPDTSSTGGASVRKLGVGGGHRFGRHRRSGSGAGRGVREPCVTPQVHIVYFGATAPNQTVNNAMTNLYGDPQKTCTSVIKTYRCMRDLDSNGTPETCVQAYVGDNLGRARASRRWTTSSRTSTSAIPTAPAAPAA